MADADRKRAAPLPAAEAPFDAVTLGLARSRIEEAGLLDRQYPAGAGHGHDWRQWDGSEIPQ